MITGKLFDLLIYAVVYVVFFRFKSKVERRKAKNLSRICLKKFEISDWRNRRFPFLERVFDGAQFASRFLNSRLFHFVSLLL